jgi:hypothetical protein
MFQDTLKLNSPFLVLPLELRRKTSQLGWSAHEMSPLLSGITARAWSDRMPTSAKQRADFSNFHGHRPITRPELA